MMNNKDQVAKKLAEMLYELDVERCPYDMDIYLYIDEFNNGSLDYFINPGGNSWLDDDHITLYTYKQWNGGDSAVLDSYEPDDVAQVLNMSLDELKERVAKYYIYDISEVTVRDIYSYVENHDELMKLVIEDYNDSLKDEVDYLEIAYDILNHYEEEEERRAKYAE